MADIALTRFNLGVFSPKMAGLTEYKGACSTLHNMIAAVQGYVFRRGGTRMIYNLGEKCRLCAFRYSNDESYMLAFGNLKLSVFYGRQLADEIEAPYAAADLDGLFFYQTGDVVYIAHPKYPTRKLIRKNKTTWSFEIINFKDGPYLQRNLTEISLTATGGGTDFTLSASAPLFTSTDVGRWIRFNTAPATSGTTASWASGTIKSVTSATQVVFQKTDGNVHLNSPTKIWNLGAFGETTGYAQTVALHEQRLVLTFSKYVFLSKTEATETFSLSNEDGSVPADMGMSLVVNMENSKRINWVVSDQTLVVGTDGEEYVIKANNWGDKITPENVSASRQSSNGSEPIKPVSTGGGFLFVKRFGKKILHYRFSSENYGYNSSNLSVFAEDLTQAGISQMAFCSEETPIVWSALKNGSLAGMTLSAENNVVAFHTHDVGGFVESIAVIPSLSELRDELYLVVHRTVNGQERHYLEVLEYGLSDEAADSVEAFFVDCGVTKRFEEKTKEVSGLEHLEGETVAVLADGAVQPEKTVSEGKIILDSPARVIHAGLPFQSVLEPTPLSFQESVLEMTPKRIVKILLRLFKSVGLKTGPDRQHLNVMHFRTTSDRMDQEIPLFTGDREMEFSASPAKNATVCVVQDQPLPLTLLAMFLRIEVGR